MTVEVVDRIGLWAGGLMILAAVIVLVFAAMRDG